MQLLSLMTIAFLALCTVLFAPRAGATDLTVFAAASLKNALDDVIESYEAKEKTDVTVSYAGSSTLARQIEFGAPADVFISANEAWMNRLVTSGKIVDDSRVNLLGNNLVLIGPASDPQTLDLNDKGAIALALGQGRLAMALVDAVPAGIYGKAALQHFDLWETVSGQVAQTDSVRAAMALVSIGATRMGIVYETDARAEPRVAIKAAFPEDSHPDIVYPAALLDGRQTQAAQAFLDYLQSPEADAVFDAYGFRRPAE